MAARIIHESISVGGQYGRWTVVASTLEKTASGRSKWSCRCQCGTIRNVAQLSLKNGTSVSCGCYSQERSIEANTTHGEIAGGKKSPEYQTWQAMIDRCQNPRNRRFSDYGGRGIEVCERWCSFDAFLQDMGRRPSSRHSLDREKNHLGYSPENCRWALPHTQMTNRSITRFVEVDGQQVPLATLAHQHGIPANTLRFRILKGWPLRDALTKPVRPKAKAA